MSRICLGLAVPFVLLALPVTVAASAPPPPVPGGLLGTLVQGAYSCEAPGDAAGPAAIPMKDLDFKVVNGSGYRFGAQRGSYLLVGDVVTMTGGPLEGMRLHRVKEGFLRRIEADGTDGPIRCVLGTRAVANAPYVTSPAKDEEQQDDAGADGAEL